MLNHRFGWKSDILYIWVIKVKCKNTIFFFWPLRGPTGATKLRDFDKFALNKDTLNGCNFFVFEDNWKIQIAGERYWLGQKKYFCHFRVSQIFFFKNSKLRLKLQKWPRGGHRGGSIFFGPKCSLTNLLWNSKIKKMTFFHFLGFFGNLVHPIFQNFMKNQVLWRKKHFRGVVDK